MDSPKTLKKSEKLCSQTAIDALFSPTTAAKGALAYPLRMVSAPRSGMRRAGAAPVQFLISIPKKRLRKAVDRVKMRRRVREAYRLNRGLIRAMNPEENMDVAFVYIANSLTPYDRVDRAMKKLLSAL